MIAGLRRALAAKGLDPSRAVAVLYLSDRTGGWSLYAVRGSTSEAAEPFTRARRMGLPRARVVQVAPLLGNGELVDVGA